MQNLYSDPALFFETVTRTPLHPQVSQREDAMRKLRQFIAEKEHALQNAPEGILLIGSAKQPGFSPEYYCRNGSTRKYLPASRRAFARQLAQRDYDMRQLKEAQRVLNLWERIANRLTFRDAFETLRKERRDLVVPDYLSDKEVRELWANIKYERLGFPPNYPEYYTSSNLRVRSGAERSIGNRLEERNILLLYEYPFRMRDGGIVYPDFTCLNLRTRQLFLWEHLGRLDDERYLEANLRKLRRYRNSGYHLGINLIVSYELSGDVLTEAEIDLLIDHSLV